MGDGIPMGKKIRNLSIRKTILLYMATALIISFFLSAEIAILAGHMQTAVWRKYWDENELLELLEHYGTQYVINGLRPSAYKMTPSDRFISELCDFLQTYAVLVLSMTGSCAAVFLFYKNKLKHPIAELALASKTISENNLDFHVTYENQDEMGTLCREFEHMRAQLAENNLALWKTIEEERALRAAISHDIRSPLSVLKGYHEMLTDYLPAENIDKDHAMKMLAECGKQLDRMDVFVDTMRKMNSLESRALKPDEITADMLASEIGSESVILQKDSGRQILLHTVLVQGVFCGDKELIWEVVENLLSNALRYARNEVTVTLSVTHSECRISIADDGSGFPKSMENLTEAFYSQNAKDSLKHAGMGMYISRLYCEKHGGAILLENAAQGGASVTAVFRRIS